MSIYGTNPESPPSHLISQKENIFWDHKEATIQEFMNLGVPLRPAELAVIDLKSYLYIAQRNKLTPEQTARMMLPEVERVYKRKNGTWSYT